MSDRLCCMCLSILHRRHSIPLAWRCYAPGHVPCRQPDLVKAILQQAHDALDPGAVPVLMLDRGLAWPALVDWCREHRWHFIMRLQGQTCVCLENPGGSWKKPVSAACLAGAKGGTPVMGRAKVFKTVGYRVVNFVGVWPRQAKDRWLLATDLRASLKRCREYAKRMDAEHGFRDQKSHGLNWQASRITRPQHAAMLVLAMALALYLLYAVAALPEASQTLRGALERADRHALSVLQLGIRWLKRTLMLPQACWPEPPPLQISVGR